MLHKVAGTVAAPLSSAVSYTTHMMTSTLSSLSDRLRGINIRRARSFARDVHPNNQQMLEAGLIGDPVVQESLEEEGVFYADSVPSKEELMEDILRHALQTKASDDPRIPVELFYYDSIPFIHAEFEKSFEMRAFPSTHPLVDYLSQLSAEDVEPAVDQGHLVGPDVATLVIWWEEYVKRGIRHIVREIHARYGEEAYRFTLGGAPFPEEASDVRVNGAKSIADISEMSKKEQKGEDDGEEPALESGTGHASQMMEPVPLENENSDTALEDHRELALDIYGKVREVGRLSGLDVPNDDSFMYETFSVDIPVAERAGFVDTIWLMSEDHPYAILLQSFEYDAYVVIECHYGCFVGYLDTLVEDAIMQFKQLFKKFELEWTSVIDQENGRPDVLIPPDHVAMTDPEDVQVAIPAPDPIYTPPVLTGKGDKKQE